MGASVFYADGGEYATITNTFRDTATNVATDPGTVQCVVTDPLAATTTYTYAASQITRVSQGVYALTVACPTAGVWMYEWTGTSPAADVQAGTWTVLNDDLGHLYCTAEELKSRLKIEDTDDDFEVLVAVQAASRSIDDITRRYFWRGDDTRTYQPGSIYEVPVDDLVSLTSLKTDHDGDGIFETTWTTGQYELLVAPGKYNVNSRGEPWPYTRIRAIGIGQYFPVPNLSARMDIIQVTGVFGWPSVPIAVKEAAQIAAADLFKLKDAPFGIAGYGEFGVVRVRQNPRVMQLLRRYMNADSVGV